MVTHYTYEDVLAFMSEHRETPLGELHAMRRRLLAAAQRREITLQELLARGALVGLVIDVRTSLAESGYVRRRL